VVAASVLGSGGPAEAAATEATAISDGDGLTSAVGDADAVADAMERPGVGLGGIDPPGAGGAVGCVVGAGVGRGVGFGVGFGVGDGPRTMTLPVNPWIVQLNLNVPAFANVCA
jgi:hypothetical protein